MLLVIYHSLYLLQLTVSPVLVKFESKYHIKQVPSWKKKLQLDFINKGKLKHIDCSCLESLSTQYCNCSPSPEKLPIDCIHQRGKSQPKSMVAIDLAMPIRRSYPLANLTARPNRPRIYRFLPYNTVI